MQECTSQGRRGGGRGGLDAGGEEESDQEEGERQVDPSGPQRVSGGRGGARGH